MPETGEQELPSDFKPKIIGYHREPGLLKLFQEFWAGKIGEFKKVDRIEQLIEEVREHPPTYDIILIQLGKDKSGLKAAGKIRELAPTAIIALMTGGAEDLERERQEFDINTILAMPITYAVAIEFLKDATRLAAQHRAKNN